MKELSKEEALQAARFKRQVSGLTLEVEELWKVHQETKTLLFGKSQEAYARNNELRSEMEKLKEELAGRDEEVARQKDELLWKTKEDLMSDVTDSYTAGFEDVVARATCIYY